MPRFNPQIILLVKLLRFQQRQKRSLKLNIFLYSFFFFLGYFEIALNELNEAHDIFPWCLNAAVCIICKYFFSKLDFDEQSMIQRKDEFVM